MNPVVTREDILLSQRGSLVSARISFINKAEFVKAMEIEREINKIDRLLGLKDDNAKG